MKFQCSLKCKEMLLFQHQLFLLIKLSPGERSYANIYSYFPEIGM